MLQQTQVDRVIPFFKKWMRSFPSLKKLSQASQRDVLAHWKGLGYNSRALRLQKLAQIIMDAHGGNIPMSTVALEALPGIGPYTASAVRIFVRGEPDICIETNIRRIFLHHFFTDQENVHDRDIYTLIEKTFPVNLPDHPFFADHTIPHVATHWYWALMDYGSHLPKRIGKNSNTQSKHYTQQKKFKGSDREIRGKILALLLEHQTLSRTRLYTMLGTEKDRYARILDDMKREGFITMTGRRVFLVDR